jgi:hypothetical protein
MTTRRSFLGAILAAGVAPAAIGSGILMPVKRIARVDSFGTRGFIFVNGATNIQWSDASDPYVWNDREYRALLDNALVTNTHPKAMMYVDDWVEPGKVVRRCLKPGERVTVTLRDRTGI